MSFISFVQTVITQYIATIIVLNSNLLGQLRIRKIKYFILIYSFYNYLPYFIYILASDLHNYFSQLKNFFQQFLMGRYVDTDFSWVLKTCFFSGKNLYLSFKSEQYLAQYRILAGGFFFPHFRYFILSYLHGF